MRYFPLLNQLKPCTMSYLKPILLWLLVGLLTWPMAAQKPTETPPHLTATSYSAFSFRAVGPAVTSGRIADFAVHPHNPHVYYVATASGGVWKTVNHGTTYEPIFDGQGSYSIGCVSLDPNNPSTVWVGTGENNNQRSIGYGDGVYRSTDGGKSWTHMGLKDSEHIADIIVDPTDSDIVYVAAYGPLWRNGGERGVYKSTDGGATWTCVKAISDYTGCSQLRMDPSNRQVLYAAFHQRQRKVFTYIGGGPESGLYKSIDGGENWTQLKGGLPSGELGRIGLDLSPVAPQVVYAVVEGDEKSRGIYRSADGGASWSKQSSYASSGNYYQELICDPQDVDRIFITDTYFQVSDDGGKTTRKLGEINKHIDNHAIWIDPTNTDHLLVGCDGGIYETWDFARSWHFKPNLPVTQFYKVSTDNALPFYHIHGGTQDNLSLGGPSRTTSMNGIVNSDWYVTSTGDGFETQVDPTDPNIIYAQAQYGALSRFDRRNGEYYYIKPMEGPGEEALRWNWDAPLLLSNHDPKRLYFGANKVFRTDDRGDSWQLISPDLSRGLDRNTLEVMDQVWSVDAIMKNRSTDIFGQTTTIAESPLDEKVLWVGTDDGLIHLTTDGGQNWQRFDNFPGVPEMTYVHQIIASQHDRLTAYAAFNNHRSGDFKPYLYQTSDGGKSWKALDDTLPERGSVYTVAEDHIKPELLFCGTEFGAFFSPDRGAHWLALKSGLPTIAVRDMEIQRRENDLVLGTFGRGFYVLDDYSPLRHIHAEALAEEAAIFPIKKALQYVPRTTIGLRDKGHLGSSYFTAPNPAMGAVFTYHLKEDIVTLKEARRKREKETEDDPYPSLEELQAEDQQAEPYLLFTVRNASGEVVRHLKAPAKAGIKRITWDLRHATPAPVTNRYTPDPDVLFGSAELGHLVMPGTYAVTLSKYEDGQLTALTEAVPFEVEYLNQASLPTDRAAYDTFVRKVADLRKAFAGANRMRGEMQRRLQQLDKALIDLPAPNGDHLAKLHDLQAKLHALTVQMNGDATLARNQFETPPSIGSRISRCEYGLWDVTASPTKSYQEIYADAAAEFGPALAALKALHQEIMKFEGQLEQAGAPHTPGRWPDWPRG
jgi:photosystem II stability/assembly factor-like uncharacterized protein